MFHLVSARLYLPICPGHSLLGRIGREYKVVGFIQPDVAGKAGLH
jgi:hypothetical protein